MSRTSRRGAAHRLASLVLLCLVAASACSSTKMVDTWKAPDLGPSDLDFQKVVAIAIFPEESRTRIAEDTLSEAAERVPITAAHRVLGREDRRSVDRLRAAVESNGFDGAIVVRLVSQTQQERWIPGTYSGGFYGYYGGYAGRVYDPGYMVTDTTVQIETSLHDVESGRLLWSGVSETLNPTKVETLIDEVAAEAGKALREEGLLP